MERLLLNKYLVKDLYLIDGSDEYRYFVLDCKDKDNIKIEIDKNNKANLLLLNLSENAKVNISLKDDSYLNIKSVLKTELKALKLDAKLGKGAEIDAYFADFSYGDNKVDVLIDMPEDDAKAYWHLASLSSKKDNKEFEISLNHKGLNTYGLSDNYGVSKDDSRLIFSGTSSINNGSKNSKTRQNAKIMVFDEKSIAIARPVLKIDENEIEASHGASVGKISDEQMFYLTSRGLTQEQAKELITLGYLRPILKGFEEDEIKEEISSLIEGRM